MILNNFRYCGRTYPHCFNCMYLIDCDVDKCAKGGCCKYFKCGCVTVEEIMKIMNRMSLPRNIPDEKIKEAIEKYYGGECRVEHSIKKNSKGMKITKRYFYVQCKKP